MRNKLEKFEHEMLDLSPPERLHAVAEILHGVWENPEQFSRPEGVLNFARIMLHSVCLQLVEEGLEWTTTAKRPFTPKPTTRRNVQ